MFKINVSMKAALCAAVAIAIAVTTTGVVQAQVKKGKVRAMKTAQWMKNVMKPQCEALKKGLDAGPASDDSWEALSVNAALLNEASYLLMDDGRCPDGVWADAASKTLRQGSTDVLKAIKAKDVAAAKSAFSGITKACAACHEKHKEKKPAATGPGVDKRGRSAPRGEWLRVPLREHRAVANPVQQDHNLFEGERFLAFGRHHVVVLRRQENQLHEVAADGIAWLDGGLAALAAFERPIGLIDPVAALLLLGTVALDALGFEQRLHLFHEGALVRVERCGIHLG